jgi:hypothetical protein
MQAGSGKGWQRLTMAKAESAEAAAAEGSKERGNGTVLTIMNGSEVTATELSISDK